MSSLARLATHRPWRVLLAFLALAAIGLGLSGAVSGRLSDGLSDYDDPASASTQARVAVQRATGIDVEEGYTLLVRLSTPASVSSSPPAIVAEAIRVLRRRPEVVQIVDAWSQDLPELIANGGRSTIVVASLRPLDEVSAVHALQATIDADPLLAGHVLLGGSTALDAQGNDQSLRDLSFAETIAIPILLVLMLLIFGSVVAGLLPLFGALVSIGLTTLGLLLATLVGDISVYSLNLVYALGIGLSIDFSLLMVSRYREEMASSGPGAAALTRTLTTAGRTVLFSAATVTAALGCLLLFPIPAISSMGLAGMIVTVASAVSAVVALPALLALLGARVDALSVRRRHGAPAVNTGGWWARLARGVMRHPAPIALVVALVLVGAGAPVLGVQFTGYSTKGLPAGLPAVKVDNIVAAGYSDVSNSPLQLIVRAGPSAASAVAAYVSAVARVPGVAAIEKPTMIGFRPLGDQRDAAGHHPLLDRGGRGQRRQPDPHLTDRVGYRVHGQLHGLPGQPGLPPAHRRRAARGDDAAHPLRDDRVAGAAGAGPPDEHADPGGHPRTCSASSSRRASSAGCSASRPTAST